MVENTYPNADGGAQPKGRFGLIGYKLGHSYSPAIHALLGDYEYKLYELAEAEVGLFLRSRTFDGLNVTIPYKKTVVPFLDQLSDVARELGSVNTVLRRPDGTLYGDNTDIVGALGLLERSGVNISGRKVLVLGSGGTGVTFALAVRKAGGVPVIISRSGGDNYDNIERHSDAVMLMNATPVGMYPHTGASPVDLTRLPNLKCVIDAIYNPERTALLQQAEALGMQALNGLYMLVRQAAAAAELFTGRHIDPAAVPAITAQIAAQMYHKTADGGAGVGHEAADVGAEKTGGSETADGGAGVGNEAATKTARGRWAAPRPKLLVINGPNINMLGIREPDIYGSQNYEALLKFIDTCGAEFGADIECFQSNHEGAIVDRIQAAYGHADGIVINPAAYTHTSVAIPDALKAVALPAVEVHLSDINSREAYRRVSYTSEACIGTFAGLGFESYRQAIRLLTEHINTHATNT